MLVLSSLKTTGVLLGGGGLFNEVDVLKSGWLSNYLNWVIIASVRCRGRNGAAAFIPPLMQIARAICLLSFYPPTNPDDMSLLANNTCHWACRGDLAEFKTGEE